MNAITVRPHPYCERGKVLLMRNFEHPEIDFLTTTLDNADHVIVACPPRR